MRGLNMGAKIHITPQFNAQHYATPAGVRICFCIFPGGSPLARLHARAILWHPDGAQKIGSLTLAVSPPQLTICLYRRGGLKSHFHGGIP